MSQLAKNERLSQYKTYSQQNPYPTHKTHIEADFKAKRPSTPKSQERIEQERLIGNQVLAEIERLKTQYKEDHALYSVQQARYAQRSKPK